MEMLEMFLNLPLYLDLHQKFMWSILGWEPSSIQVSWKSILEDLCNPADKQTDTGENMKPPWQHSLIKWDVMFYSLKGLAATLSWIWATHSDCIKNRSLKHIGCIKDYSLLSK